MRYFTDNPLERMMMEVPRPCGDEEPPSLPKDHPCRGCKRYGEVCVLPCYRGITKQQRTPKEAFLFRDRFLIYQKGE